MIIYNRGWVNTTRGVLRHGVVEKKEIKCKRLKLELDIEDTSAVLDQMQTLYPDGIVHAINLLRPRERGRVIWRENWLT